VTEFQSPGYPPPFPTQWAPLVQGPSMPGTVRAAAIITYVCAAVTVAMTLLMVLFVVFVGSFVFGSFQRSDRAEMVLFVLVGVLISVGCSTIACWFAWQTGRRKQWARYGLAGCSVLTVAVSMLAFSPPTMLSLLGAVAVLVLLFVPETNAWFRTVD
jgi:hypothetical protein